MKRHSIALALVGALALAACSEDAPEPVSPEIGSIDVQDVSAEKGHQKENGDVFATDPAREAEIQEKLTRLARDVEQQVADMRAEAGADPGDGVGVAPLGYFWTGHLEGQTVGNEVLFEDRGNKQLDPQWVPGDERRNGRTDIGYAVAGAFGAASPPGLTPAEVDGAVDRAMDTWDGQNCSKGLPIPEGTLLDWLLFDADILHGGFAVLPPGVIGVTFPFVFTDAATGEPTDVDSDGHPDYAFAIIQYNIDFDWAIDDDIDMETIALHEAGHGLAQGHFGKAFATTANRENRKLHFAPRAVMNAAYSGVQQSLTGTDQGGHCSMYGSWPNN